MVEIKKTIAYLGPEGTNSYHGLTQFFPSAQGIPCSDLVSAAMAVAQKKAYQALMPFENSQTGLIPVTFDAVLSNNLTIVARYDVPIHHQLISQSAIKQIKTIYSHPQAFEQCKQWIKKNAPKAILKPVESTASAVKIIQNEPEAAVIGNSAVAERHRLIIRARDIEDTKDNMTRFWLIAAKKEYLPDLTHDTVTVFFTVAHKPGSLVKVLECFKDEGINMLHLHSHALLGRPWEYGFFASFSASASDPHFKNAANFAAPHMQTWRILGSYKGIHFQTTDHLLHWASIDRLSGQLQSNRKVLYQYLEKYRPSTKNRIDEHLDELRLLLSVSIGKYKWQHMLPVRDAKREQTLTKEFNQINKNPRQRKDFENRLRISRDVQAAVITALRDKKFMQDEIIDLPLADARYYIDQVDFWIRAIK